MRHEDECAEAQADQADQAALDRAQQMFEDARQAAKAAAEALKKARATKKKKEKEDEAAKKKKEKEDEAAKKKKEKEDEAAKKKKEKEDEAAKKKKEQADLREQKQLAAAQKKEDEAAKKKQEQEEKKQEQEQKKLAAAKKKADEAALKEQKKLDREARIMEALGLLKRFRSEDSAFVSFVLEQTKHKRRKNPLLIVGLDDAASTFPSDQLTELHTAWDVVQKCGNTAVIRSATKSSDHLLKVYECISSGTNLDDLISKSDITSAWNEVKSKKFLVENGGEVAEYYLKTAKDHSTEHPYTNARRLYDEHTQAYEIMFRECPEVLHNLTVAASKAGIPLAAADVGGCYCLWTGHTETFKNLVEIFSVLGLNLALMPWKALCDAAVLREDFYKLPVDTSKAAEDEQIQNDDAGMKDAELFLSTISPALKSKKLSPFAFLDGPAFAELLKLCLASAAEMGCQLNTTAILGVVDLENPTQELLFLPLSQPASLANLLREKVDGLQKTIPHDSNDWQSLVDLLPYKEQLMVYNLLEAVADSLDDERSARAHRLTMPKSDLVKVAKGMDAILETLATGSEEEKAAALFTLALHKVVGELFHQSEDTMKFAGEILSEKNYDDDDESHDETAPQEAKSPVGVSTADGDHHDGDESEESDDDEEDQEREEDTQNKAVSEHLAVLKDHIQDADDDTEASPIYHAFVDYFKMKMLLCAFLQERISEEESEEDRKHGEDMTKADKDMDSVLDNARCVLERVTSKGGVLYTNTPRILGDNTPESLLLLPLQNFLSFWKKKYANAALDAKEKQKGADGVKDTLTSNIEFPKSTPKLLIPAHDYSPLSATQSLTILLPPFEKKLCKAIRERLKQIEACDEGDTPPPVKVSYEEAQALVAGSDHTVSSRTIRKYACLQPHADQLRDDGYYGEQEAAVVPRPANTLTPRKKSNHEPTREEIRVSISMWLDAIEANAADFVELSEDVCTALAEDKDWVMSGLQKVLVKSILKELASNKRLKPDAEPEGSDPEDSEPDAKRLKSEDPDPEDPDNEDPGVEDSDNADSDNTLSRSLPPKRRKVNNLKDGSEFRSMPDDIGESDEESD